MSLKSTREFILQEKIGSLKDKVYVMDTDKNKLGYFKGKLIKIGNTFRLYTMDEKVLLTVNEKMISMKSTYEFYKGAEKDDDQLIGKLKKKLISIRPKYYFEDPDEEKVYEVKGKVFRLKYKIRKHGDTVAEIRKKFFKSILKDSYGVKMKEDLSDEDALVILGMVIMLHHEKEEAN